MHCEILSVAEGLRGASENGRMSDSERNHVLGPAEAPSESTRGLTWHYG